MKFVVRAFVQDGSTCDKWDVDKFEVASLRAAARRFKVFWALDEWDLRGRYDIGAVSKCGYELLSEYDALHGKRHRLVMVGIVGSENAGEATYAGTWVRV